MLKALLFLLTLVFITFGQKIMEEAYPYRTLLDSLALIHVKKQKAEYDSTTGTQRYFWSFIDVGKYPYWCADTPLTVKKSSTIRITDQGTTIQIYKDNAGEHVRVAMMAYNQQVTEPKTRSFWLYFFHQDKKDWKMDREPLKTTVKLDQEGKYYYCEKCKW